jgi:4'-phosphopantetheinyl transferase
MMGRGFQRPERNPSAAARWVEACSTSVRMRRPEQEIDLWQVSLDRDGPEPSAELDAADLNRAERFRCPCARLRFLQCRAALRHVLARYLGAAPREVRLVSSLHGKPELADASAGLHFNLSHSDALALIAVSARPVGVDVERLRDDLEWQQLTRLCCTDDERDAIGSSSSFLALWTAKEAYVKARGFGLQAPLTALRVVGRCIHAAAPWGDGKTWMLHSLNELSGHVGAVATPIEDAEIRRHRDPVL